MRRQRARWTAHGLANDPQSILETESVDSGLGDLGATSHVCGLLGQLIDPPARQGERLGDMVVRGQDRTFGGPEIRRGRYPFGPEILQRALDQLSGSAGNCGQVLLAAGQVIGRACGGQ
jgi:hypothetical protein